METLGDAWEGGWEVSAVCHGGMIDLGREGQEVPDMRPRLQTPLPAVWHPWAAAHVLCAERQKQAEANAMNHREKHEQNQAVIVEGGFRQGFLKREYIPSEKHE